jgi:UDP-N-acetyl-D-glucosamine dehydrogenase
MVNEMALICERLGVNVYEVIDAAATKPFGFLPFYPGPGLGGHCIPIDPHYLAWKLKALNFHARFIALATEINEMMPSVVSLLVTEALNRLEKSVRGSKILILGVAYKKGVNDVRESPAVDVMRILSSQGAHISYNDPFVSEVAVGETYLESVELSPAVIRDHDCLVILTDHSDYDLGEILRWAKVVVDTRNATKGYEKFQDKILRLGGKTNREDIPSNGNGRVETTTTSIDPELTSLLRH